MSVIFSNCAECDHFIAAESNGICSCSAFPNGIPIDYMFRKDQNKETECNNGIKFSSKE